MPCPEEASAVVVGEAEIRQAGAPRRPVHAEVQSEHRDVVTGRRAGRVGQERGAQDDTPDDPPDEDAHSIPTTKEVS